MLKKLSERFIETFMVQKEYSSEILLQVDQSKHLYYLVQCAYSSRKSHDSTCILPQKTLSFGHGISPYHFRKIWIYILLHETRNDSQMISPASMKFVGDFSHGTLYRTSGNDSISTQ